MLRHGARIGITERRLLAGHWLFERHGGKIVVFGRFFAILRTLAAVLAGVTTMDWRRFLTFQCIASVIWALFYGGTAYVFGKRIQHVTGPVGIIAAGVMVVAIGVVIVLTHRHGDRLERIAAVRARKQRRRG